jgi:hypothetical protein
MRCPLSSQNKKLSILCLNWSNTILAAPRQQRLEMADSNGDGNGQRRWQLQWPTMTKTAIANGNGNSDSNSNSNGKS